MIRYRTATSDELGIMLDWAAEEGWNPGLDDAAAFYAADKGGFFVAEQDGQLIASISVVNHNDHFAFLGLYIVRPDWRGLGIGFELWQHAITHAEDRVIGLDGVQDQQANYASSGFVLAGATTRFSGWISPRIDGNVAVVDPVDISELIAQETFASGQNKPLYLRAWFAETTNRKTLALKNGDTVVGFCTVRACHSGAKVGPLFCITAEDAKRLLRHAASVFDGEIIIDVPASSTALAELCRSLDMTPGFETARMYRGTFNPSPRPVFAVASLELG